MIVYHCCPEVADGNKGLTDAGGDSRLREEPPPPTILELIALTAVAGGLNAEVKARANFTSTPASES